MVRLGFSLPFTGVSRKQRIAFYNQLEPMLDAGIPPVRSLRSIAGQGHSRKMKRVILDMADHIESGGSLASAMERHAKVFPALERQVIGAAESGGFSIQAIASLARFQTEMRHLWIRLGVDMIYPGFLLFTALVICPLLQAFFLGGVENVLESLLWNAAAAFAVILVLITALRFLNSLSLSRGILHWFALHTPFLGRVVRGFAITHFVQTLASLYSAGFPVRDAFIQSAQSCGNDRIARRLRASSVVLDEGGSLSEAIVYSGLFSPMAQGMILTGEESGKLDVMLNKYAQFQVQETETQLKILSQMLPFLIYFLVAGYIVYIILNFYMKYFSMIQGI